VFAWHLFSIVDASDVCILPWSIFEEKEQLGNLEKTLSFPADGPIHPIA
jgi:hypothetical protein